MNFLITDFFFLLNSFLNDGILKEVFADPSRDESLVFELLEFKHEVADDFSASWFLRDLAEEQDAELHPVILSYPSTLYSFVLWEYSFTF